MFLGQVQGFKAFNSKAGFKLATLSQDKLFPTADPLEMLQSNSSLSPGKEIPCIEEIPCIDPAYTMPSTRLWFKLAGFLLVQAKGWISGGGNCSHSSEVS